MGTQYVEQSIPEPQVTSGNALRSTLLENDEVLVIANSYPPGASVPMHVHRFPSVVYVVEGGTLETTAPDGTVEGYDMRPGQTLWSGAAHAHAARNTGLTPLRLVEIEVKHAASIDSSQQAAHVLIPERLEWQPDSVDPRRARAQLLGDPDKAGPFTVRYRAPAGYELGLHVHSEDDEQLTVLSGAIRWSIGEAGSGAPEHLLKAGGFAVAPAGTPHRIVAVEDSVLQMSGIGPHTYDFVNADPRVKR